MCDLAWFNDMLDASPDEKAKRNVVVRYAEKEGGIIEAGNTCSYTRKGPKGQADLDQGSYPTGLKISDKRLAAVPLTRHEWHGNGAWWNYTVHSTTE